MPERRKRKPPPTTLYCELCNYSTKYKNCLKAHIMGHAMIKPYPCPYCDYGTKFRPSLQRHILIKHAEKIKDHNIKAETFKCDICDYTTNFKWNLKGHKRKHKDEKQFKCTYCDYETAYRHNFLKHSKTHHQKQIEKFQCDKCPFVTKFEGHIQRHLAKIHHVVMEAAHNCELCGFSTRFKWRLNIHTQRSKHEDVIKCGYCPFQCYFMCQFKKHRELHYLQIYGGNKKKYKVQNVEKAKVNTVQNQIEESIQDYDAMQGIVEDKNAEYRYVGEDNEATDQFELKEKFKCEKCSFETKYEVQISRHLIKVHNEILPHEFRCEYCDYSITFKSKLDIHLQQSLQEQAIKCPHCIFETYYMCQIKKHASIHFNEVFGTRQLIHFTNNTEMSPYTPDFGGTKQNMQQNLITEQNIHNEGSSVDMGHTPDIEDNFMSEQTELQTDESTVHAINGKSNNKYKLESGSIDWHSIQVLESDNKEKPFQCHMCDYTSKFKASVQRHFQRLHTGSQNRPYKCVNCDFSTKTKDQIALHNKRSQSETMLTCKICSFTTFYKCQYVTHQRSHYINKCNLCSYSCRHKYELIKHFSSFHLGNSLKCQYCDYRAARKESIVCHETIHTGEKPYKCDICDYQTVRRCLLDLHKKRHHFIQTDVTIVSRDTIESLKVVEDIDNEMKIDDCV